MFITNKSFLKGFVMENNVMEYSDFKKNIMAKLDMLVPKDRQGKFRLVAYNSGNESKGHMLTHHEGIMLTDGKDRSGDGFLLPSYKFSDLYESYKSSNVSVDKFLSSFMSFVCSDYDSAIEREKNLGMKIEKIKAECPEKELILSCTDDKDSLSDKAVVFTSGKYAFYLSALLTPIDVIKNSESFTVYDVPKKFVESWKDETGHTLDFSGTSSKLFEIAQSNTEKYFPPVVDKRLGLDKIPFFRISTARDGICSAFYNGNLKDISKECGDSLVIYPVSDKFYYAMPYQNAQKIGLSQAFDKFSYVFSPTGINDDDLDIDAEKWYYHKDSGQLVFNKQDFMKIDEISKARSL